jgi:tetratricopeptide (TPR) repeat protein
VRRFQQLDPLDPWDYSLEGALYWMDGRYDLSLEQYRRWYQSDPDNPHARFIYALALTYEKEFDEAFSIIDRGAETTADNVFTKLGLLLKYGLLKEKEKALREVTPDFEKTCRRDQHWSYWVAVGLALADAKEESIDWLENAVNKGFINYPELERSPYFDNLRGEDRFKKLLERVKYEWEHFEV